VRLETELRKSEKGDRARLEATNQRMSWIDKTSLKTVVRGFQSQEFLMEIKESKMQMVETKNMDILLSLSRYNSIE
jgi:hypothetical protein